jgi:hypothetical protein
MAIGAEKFVTWIRNILPEKVAPTGTENIYVDDSGVSRKANLANTVYSVIDNLPRINGVYCYDSNMINTITSNNYTLVITDNGKMVVSSNTFPTIITVPPDLGNTFSCMVLDVASSNVNITNTSGSYIFNSANSYSLSSKYSSASIYCYGVANNYIINGDLR